MKLRIMKIIFEDIDLSARDTPKLRGAIAGKFPRYTLLHNHLEAGRLLYQYPRVQYKVINGSPMILGIEEGIGVLEEVYGGIGEMKLSPHGPSLHSELKIELAEGTFGEADDLFEYSFATPWMALNQNNYYRYLEGPREVKERLLKSILVGNILALSKSLGYEVKSHIFTSLRLSEMASNFKDNRMLSFRGEFLVNFRIPDYLGLGKSVARGFGTVIRAG
ncbi:MAG: CRISPR-associated endonuclease Cas6 [Syntrophobacteraceae bacterium]|jgi:hypothetical protein